MFSATESGLVNKGNRAFVTVITSPSLPLKSPTAGANCVAYYLNLTVAAQVMPSSRKIRDALSANAYLDLLTA